MSEVSCLKASHRVATSIDNDDFIGLSKHLRCNWLRPQSFLLHNCSCRGLTQRIMSALSCDPDLTPIPCAGRSLIVCSEFVGDEGGNGTVLGFAISSCHLVPASSLHLYVAAVFAVFTLSILALAAFYIAIRYGSQLAKRMQAYFSSRHPPIRLIEFEQLENGDPSTMSGRTSPTQVELEEMDFEPSRINAAPTGAATV